MAQRPVDTRMTVRWSCPVHGVHAEYAIEPRTHPTHCLAVVEERRPDGSVKPAVCRRELVRTELIAGA